MGNTIPGESRRVMLLSSFTCRDSLVTPASAPVTTLSPWPRRRVKLFIILDFPVFGKPMTPTDNVRLTAAERDFRALCNSNETFLGGKRECEY